MDDWLDDDSWSDPTPAGRQGPGQQEYGAPGPTQRVHSTPSPHRATQQRDAVSEAIAAVPLRAVRGSTVREIFSEVLKRHSRGEAEAKFASLADKGAGGGLERLPHPWLFLRVMALLGGSFVILLLAMERSENPVAIPGVILLGSFAVPISISVLALESNTPRNISFYAFLKFVIAGAVTSLTIATIMYQYDPTLYKQFGASAAGPIEETAKLAAVVILARGIAYRWTLNGLVLGAAVGAGFAAFETAGYGFVTLLESGGSIDAMTDVLVLRAWMSVGAHVVWTAATAAALWSVLRGSRFRWSALVAPRFLGPFLLIVALHFTWNSDWAAETGIIVHLGLVAAAVAVFLGFLIKGAAEFAHTTDVSLAAKPPGGPRRPREPATVNW